MSSITTRALIEQARLRHWSFTDVQLGDGAALLWVNQRQRDLLLKYRDVVRGLVGTTVQAAATVNGSLLGISDGGTPYYLSTVGDGYAVHLSTGGTPYVDTTDDPISTDPFGQNGGTPGFPLPTDVMSILAVTVNYADGSVGPMGLVPEQERVTPSQGTIPTAFLSANRIVPIRATSYSADAWSNVTGVGLSYLGLTTLTTLDDPITMPAVMHEPLIAGLAAIFARQSKDCVANERALFVAEAKAAEDSLVVTGSDIWGAAQTTHVVYKG